MYFGVSVCQDNTLTLLGGIVVDTILDIYRPREWKRTRGMRAACWFFIIGYVFTIISCQLLFKAINTSLYESYYTILVTDNSWLHYALILPMYLIAAPFIALLFATAKQKRLGLRCDFAYMTTFISELKLVFIRVGIYLCALCTFSFCMNYVGRQLLSSVSFNVSLWVVQTAISCITLVLWGGIMALSAALIVRMQKPILSLCMPVLQGVFMMCILCAPWFILSIADFGLVTNMLLSAMILVAYVFAIPQYILTLYDVISSYQS